jgi:hypothetical protein
MTRKLDKEHLDEIQALRDKFSETSAMLGNISIERFLLQQRQDRLVNEEQDYHSTFLKLQQQETELIERLRSRYGDGQINIQDGTFTPNA